MSNLKNIYAEPVLGVRREDCHFYHTMDLPGVGRIKGEWELSNVLDEYLGGVDFSGKRVLEVGTASGFLCWQMEQAGADVVSFDLGAEYRPDNLIPGSWDKKKFVESAQVFQRALNNSYWFCHEKANLKAKMVYGTVYDIPAEIGQVDITTLCSMLLHLRDPFLALMSAARLTKDRLIITEPLWTRNHYRVSLFINAILRLLFRRHANATAGSCPWFTMQKSDQQQFSWWMLPPYVIENYISVLGFKKERVIFHRQKLEGKGNMLMYTLVGRRESEGMQSLL